MSKSRLEAFSDGVIAIIITIMVLEIKAPHEAGTSALVALWPKFLSYMLSFVMAGIYWNNHHHLLHSAKRINSAVMWSNLNLLFWLSVMPFASAWMGENHFAPLPVSVYGGVLFMAAVAYGLLVQALITLHGRDSEFAVRVGSDWKGKIPLVVYAAGAGLSFVSPVVALALYAGIAALWVIPDRRFE